MCTKSFAGSDMIKYHQPQLLIDVVQHILWYKMCIFYVDQLMDISYDRTFHAIPLLGGIVVLLCDNCCLDRATTKVTLFGGRYAGASPLRHPIHKTHGTDTGCAGCGWVD